MCERVCVRALCSDVISVHPALDITVTPVMGKADDVTMLWPRPALDLMMTLHCGPAQHWI